MRSRALGLLAVGLLAGPMAANAVVVHTTDFIADASRTNFVGFQGLPAVDNYGAVHVEDGVVVTQVNGRPDNIWTYCPVGACWATNASERSWYPNGGDSGWTEVERLDGSDFQDLGMLLGSGYGPANTVTVFYELFDDAASVLSGSLRYLPDQYLGFSGGGFDRVRLRTSIFVGDSTWGDLQALAIDNIELAGSAAVPEPASLALLGLGLVGLGLGRRRKAG